MTLLSSTIQQPPPLPQLLPRSQQEWQQLVNTFQQWQQQIAGVFSSFPVTTSGDISGNPGGAALYYQRGPLVWLMLPYLSGASASTSFNIYGLPPALQPQSIAYQGFQVGAVDNSTEVHAQVAIQKSGTIQLLLNASFTGWTNGGTKGFGLNPITYFTA